MARNPICESEVKEINMDNYKGFFYDNVSKRYQDEVTGAHFEYFDMCLNLKRLKKQIEVERSVFEDKKIQEPVVCKINLAGSHKFAKKFYKIFKAKQNTERTERESNNEDNKTRKTLRIKSITELYRQSKTENETLSRM